MFGLFFISEYWYIDCPRMRVTEKIKGMMSKGYVYGLVIGAALIAYFLLMKVLGLESNFYLRLFNFVILIAGVYFLLKSQIMGSKRTATYFEGLGLGLRATIIAVIVFLVFMASYISFIDPEFIQVLRSSQIWESRVTLSQAAIGIFIEGMASAFVISFAWMQYFKKYTVSPNASINS